VCSVLGVSFCCAAAGLNWLHLSHFRLPDKCASAQPLLLLATIMQRDLFHRRQLGLDPGLLKNDGSISLLAADMLRQPCLSPAPAGLIYHLEDLP
jgi:hypothetical protein